MGTYTQFYIADYPFDSTKGSIDPIIMTLFREMDKKTYERKFSDRNRLAWGHLDLDTLTEIETACEYSNTIVNIRQRLDLLGFSMNRSKLDFEESRKNRIQGIETRITNLSKSKYKDEFERSYKKEIKILSEHQYEDWLKIFEQIISNGWRSQKELPKELEGRLIHYALGSSFDETMFSFPFSDIRFLLRAVLEVCPDDKLVVQDITDLVDGGYYEPTDPVCEMALEFLTGDYPVVARIIVLTEGSSDKVVLEKSLALLYPHLVDYYSFMDFGMSNSSGGASALVETIKSFIGSKISNRIVAIFDNDTAARAARRNLAKTPIPPNIKILEYPHLDFAENYPTLGPNGTAETDINGLACSIECYFGADVINRDGKLVPVQWKGYNDSLGQYHGEILYKKELQASFIEKVSRCQNDSAEITRTDWEPMKLILNEILAAFSN